MLSLLKELLNAVESGNLGHAQRLLETEEIKDFRNGNLIIRGCWHIEDVKELHDDYPVSDEQAREVLSRYENMNIKDEEWYALEVILNDVLANDNDIKEYIQEQAKKLKQYETSS